MSNEQQRPGKASLADYRGPEPPKGSDELPLSPPVADDESLPPVREEVRVSGTEPAKPAPPKEPEAPKLSPFDAKRAEIASRFSKKREDDVTETDLDFRKPENLYGNLGREGGDAEPAPKAPAEQRAPSEPEAAESRTLVVNGKTVSKTLDEIAALSELPIDEVRANPERAIKYAQRELATAENHERSKQLFRRETPSRPDDADTPPASRARHQGDDQAGDDAPEQPPDGERDTSAPTAAEKLIEDIQIGDPREVAPKLARYLDDVAARRISETEARNIRRAELNANVQAVQEFLTDHPDLEGKRTVANAISAQLDAEYAADLRAILLSEGEPVQEADRILSLATREDLRNAHLERRLARHPKARPINKTMIETVWNKVQSDFGVTGTPSPVLSRQARKEVLAPQPRRASMPHPSTQSSEPQTESRRDAVRSMMRRTGRKALSPTG